jgi:hypothetical protein
VSDQDDLKRRIDEGRCDMNRRMTAQQRLIVLLLLGASFMLSVDFSMLNIALPQVGTAVGLELSKFSWIASAFA